MRQMLELGSLHVNENCVEFLREAQNYFVDPQGRFSDPDDCIDSARYALIACLQNIAEPWDNRSPQQRMSAAKHQLRMSMGNRDRERPDWKRAFDPTA